MNKPNSYQWAWVAICLVYGAIIVLTCASTQEGWKFYTRSERTLGVPVVQQLIYAETERCLGRTGDKSIIQWRVADAIFNYTDERFVDGLWLNYDTIEVVILDVRKQYDPGVISHESIHSITRLPDPLPDSVRHCEIGYSGQPDGHINSGLIRVPVDRAEFYPTILLRDRIRWLTGLAVKRREHGG